MVERRIVVAVAIAILAGSYLFAGGLSSETADPPPPDVGTVDEGELIQPAANGSYLWPYTSRSRSVEGRTLAINLVIHGSDQRARRALAARSDLEWEETSEELEDAGSGSYEVNVDEAAVDWDDASGSTRYSYVDTSPHGGGGRWLDESYQLHAGAYLGSRYHVRAYASPEDDWTAVQVHREYWDWFRLRHTVTDVHDSSRVLENDFIEQPFVSEVRREYHGIDGGWSDGWISAVELVAVALAVGSVLGRDTRIAVDRVAYDLGGWAADNRSGFLLAATLATILFGVRVAGVALETAFPTQSPKLFAAMLYPAIVAGLPLAVVALAPRLRPVSAFGFTVAGLGAAFVFDFSAIGLGVVPIRLVLHRIGLLIALGLLAVGVADIGPDTPAAARDAEVETEGPSLVLLAVLTWLAGLAMPLFGYL